MSCANPFYSPDIVDFNGNVIPIPCGQCFSCRLDFQRVTTDRLFCAWHSHSVSAFVTFTYDDDHLVIPEGFRNATLSKEHVHLYLDNIRHQVKLPFEYYVAGEYGDKFGRPHYHGLFFGLDYQLHRKFFEKWKYGSVQCLPVKAESFNYVTKYIISSNNRSFNDSHFYDLGIIPPFRKMSRGLGLSVFLDHLDELYKKGFFIYKSRKISLNRYYFNKLLSYSDTLVYIREKSLDDNFARMSEEARQMQLSISNYRRLCIENREKSLVARNLRKKSNLY